MRKKRYIVGVIRKKNNNTTKRGRPSLGKEKSLDDMSIDELKAKVRYMEAVVEFQKKIRAL